jgi:hypothetical protein
VGFGSFESLQYLLGAIPTFTPRLFCGEMASNENE